MTLPDPLDTPELRSVLIGADGDESKPQYAHTCDKCEFLGRYYSNDLYRCKHCIPGANRYQYLARYGNSSWEYMAEYVFQEARERVAERKSL